ncbi:hypothetical protein GQR58_025783 [Nymphon striatum]|nr:hypothetical protein GQR58_025783 [Nymphon striatum]
MESKYHLFEKKCFVTRSFYLLQVLGICQDLLSFYLYRTSVLDFWCLLQYLRLIELLTSRVFKEKLWYHTHDVLEVINLPLLCLCIHWHCFKLINILKLIFIYIFIAFINVILFLKLWNCRCYRTKYDEICLLLNDHNPTAMCLQETRLNDTCNTTIRQYSIYHSCLTDIFISLFIDNNVTYFSPMHHRDHHTGPVRTVAVIKAVLKKVKRHWLEHIEVLNSMLFPFPKIGKDMSLPAGLLIYWLLASGHASAKLAPACWPCVWIDSYAWRGCVCLNITPASDSGSKREDGLARPFNRLLGIVASGAMSKGEGPEVILVSMIQTLQEEKLTTILYKHKLYKNILLGLGFW